MYYNLLSKIYFLQVKLVKILQFRLSCDFYFIFTKAKQ